jgi:hypothetical protein
VLRDDVIMRMVRQLAAAIARIMKLRDAGRDEEALVEADHVWGELFGLPPGLLDSIGGPALAALLGAPEKVTAAIELLGHEADLFERRGDPARAAQRRELASYLQTRGPKGSD